MSSTLNELGTYVHDSISGYREAVGKADCSNLRSAFSMRQRERERTLARINAELRAQGKDTIDSGSVRGGLHRIWLNVTDALASGDKAVIEAVEEGEEYLKDRFEAALRNDDLAEGERVTIGFCLEEVARGEFFADQLEDIASR
ncbi:MAG: PA2169 family four-helix-bundle protein [Pseudomonadota bacterium]